jgi:hypothetical protein
VWCVIWHSGEETTDNTTKPDFSWEIEEDLLPVLPPVLFLIIYL